MARVPVDRLLADIVELRRAVVETRERSVRSRVRNVELSLRTALGTSVPKKAAAQAMGISVTALDKWIDRGILPVVARKGSSRLEVEAGPFLELLVEVMQLRSEGLERGVVASAVRRLGWRDRAEGRLVLSEEIAALPRPNVSIRELRDHYEATTPEQRVVEAARLSSAATRLAVAGREQQA